MPRRKSGNKKVQLEKGIPGSFGLNYNELIGIKRQCDNRGRFNYWQTADTNSRLFMMFRAEIIGIALSRFKWKNLPKTCDERYLEFTLITQGCASIAFPNSKPGVFFSTQLAQVGRPNIYDNPIKWDCIGNNGFRFSADNRNGVVVWDNRVRYPLLEKINMWAHELEDIVRTQQLNRQHQKIPFIFMVPQEMKQQAENMYKQVAGGEPAIILCNGMETLKPEKWDNNVPYIGKELEEEYQNKWNHIYKMLGVSNQTFKAERMIEDEVKAQREPTMFERIDPLECRRLAVRNLNERFSRFLDEPAEVVWNYDNESMNYNYIKDIRHAVAFTMENPDMVVGE